LSHTSSEIWYEFPAFSQAGGHEGCMPRVLIVDDHPIVRMGVRAMLAQASGIEVCGEAGSTAEALRLLSAEKPDVTVLDLMLGGRDGADFVKQCLRACPQTRILVLSQYDEALYAERVLKAGARGYLMKGEALDNLLHALDTVLRGDIAVSSRMNAQLLGRRFGGSSAERYSGLSNREMQIFLLIGAGRSTGAIAAELCLSPKTVGAHRENIKIKLGLGSATDLEREALLHVERLGAERLDAERLS
jgi:DNA-binding NarL/FixJ family response regulator